ncbi:MAG: sugar phosphate nucleotidyltransferase [Acidobacteriota bacterium]
MKPALVVLAAGIGSRYGGLKQIDSVGPHGEKILDYSIYDALRAGFGKLVFVIRRDIEAAFKRAVGARYENNAEVLYAYQELSMVPEGFCVPDDRIKPWGTAHATLAAEDCLDEPFAVINADDFYGAGSYELMSRFLQRAERGDGTDYAMVGFTLRDTLSDHGHVSRGICECDADGRLRRVVELAEVVKKEKGASYVDEQGAACLLSGEEIVSMNFWGFTPSILGRLRRSFEVFLQQDHDLARAEFLLPDVVDGLISSRLASVEVLLAGGPWYGITYRADKPVVAKGIEDLIRRGIYPQRLWE